MNKLLYEFKRRKKNRLLILALAAGFLWWASGAEYPCHIVRTYEIDGLEYADYVSGDNAFHCVYIEDVPQHVKEGRK